MLFNRWEKGETEAESAPSSFAALRCGRVQKVAVSGSPPTRPVTLLGPGNVSSLVWPPLAQGRECPCPEGLRVSGRAAPTWSPETHTPVWALPITHPVASPISTLTTDCCPVIGDFCSHTLRTCVHTHRHPPGRLAGVVIGLLCSTSLLIPIQSSAELLSDSSS